MPRTPVVPLSLAQETLIKRGVRVTDLAKLTGASKKSASRWLRGEKCPDEHNARSIEWAYGVKPLDWRRASEALLRALSTRQA